MRLGALIVAAVMALGGVPAAGQEVVEVQLKGAPGDVTYASLNLATEVTAQVANQRQTSRVQAEGREVTRVLGIEPDGAVLVEVVVEDLRLSVGGPEDVVSPPVMLKVRPDGRVLERQIGDYPADEFPFWIPGRPVRVGESWTRQTRFEESGLRGQGTLTFSLTGVERSGNERLARITVREEGRITGADLLGLPPGVQSRVSGTISATGEILGSVENGRTVQLRREIRSEAQIEVTTQGQTLRLTLNLQITERREALPAERVSPPTVAPEFLIVPGKAIGPVTLDQAAADVSGRLGTPSSRGPTEYRRTRLLNWPGGLTGHVEEADQSKLVGLEVSDRRYRTEKGISFGSSQGAVLLAYGMSPARLDITIPNLGGARLLIYNELGIAFAMTSDKQHAESGPGRAPVGAVDWIVIFPPGEAARIYPLP